MTVGVICIDNMPGGERSSARGTVLEIGVAEFFFPKKMEKLLLWFNNHGNFVYRPGEWEASEPASAGGEGRTGRRGNRWVWPGKLRARF